MLTEDDSIAQREFATVLPRDTVSLRLRKPRRTATGEWSCSVELTHRGLIETTEAFGEDSMQALLLGIVMARAQLVSLRSAYGLTWLGDTVLGLDFS